MEKELFQSTLLEKAKAANNNAQIDNLSERTINEVVTLFHPQFEDDTKITDDSWTLPVQMIKTLSGQLRHDTSAGINDFKSKFEAEQKAAQEKAIADAIAAAKTQWEQEHNTPPTSQANPQQPTEKTLDEKIAEAVAKATAGLTGEDGAIGKLSKQFSDYLTQQAAKEKAATEADIRSQVRDYLLERGVEEDDFALEYTLEKLVVGENPDLSALKTKAEKDYEANYKKIHKGEGAKPFAGNGGANQNSVVKDIEAWSKKRQAGVDAEAEAAKVLEQHIFK